MRKLSLTLLASALICCGNLRAQGLQFLNICTDASSLAMGGASPRNAAAMSLSQDRMDATVGYSLWQPRYESSSLMTAAGSARIGSSLAFGVDLRAMLHGSYDLVSSDGKVTGSFGPKDIAAGLCASYRIIDPLSVAVRAALVSSSLAEEASGVTAAFDLAVMYSSDALEAGLSVCNLGPKLDYGPAQSQLPTIVRAGAGYRAFGCLTASVEADYLFSSAFMAAAGIEYAPIKQLALRAGYHYGDAQKAIPSFVSAGLGLNFKGLSLDAAYLVSSKLGGSLSVCLGYGF